MNLVQTLIDVGPTPRNVKDLIRQFDITDSEIAELLNYSTGRSINNAKKGRAKISYSNWIKLCEACRGKERTYNFLEMGFSKRNLKYVKETYGLNNKDVARMTRVSYYTARRWSSKSTIGMTYSKWRKLATEVGKMKKKIENNVCIFND